MKTVLLSIGIVFAVVGISQAVDPESVARLGEMKRRISELKIAGGDAKPKFVSEPLFRYSDPTRGVSDATMWRLGEKGRPAAILILENYPTSNVPWSYELSVTSENVPKTITSPGWEWRPEPMKHSWNRIENASPPSTQKFRRTRQEKQLIRKFRTIEEWGGKTFELRLLPKSVATYEDEKAGIVSGSVYVFAHGTNSELLMLLEAVKPKDGKEHWRANFVRSGSARFEVRYDGKLFWQIGFHDTKSRHYMIAGLGDSPDAVKPK